MAQKVTVTLVDDLDGGKAEETVGFGLDGVSYEIDLSSSNAGKLRDALADFVASARKAGGRKRGPGRPAGVKAAAPASSGSRANLAIGEGGGPQGGEGCGR